MEYMVPWGLILMSILTLWRAVIICYRPTLIWDGEDYRRPSKKKTLEAHKNALKANTMTWIVWGVCFGPFVLRWWVQELLK